MQRDFGSVGKLAKWVGSDNDSADNSLRGGTLFSSQRRVHYVSAARAGAGGWEEGSTAAAGSSRGEVEPSSLHGGQHV